MMGEIMLVQSENESSFRIGDPHMAPGLSPVPDSSSTNTSQNAAASGG